MTDADGYFINARNNYDVESQPMVYVDDRDPAKRMPLLGVGLGGLLGGNRQSQTPPPPPEMTEYASSARSSFTLPPPPLYSSTPNLLALPPPVSAPAPPVAGPSSQPVQYGTNITTPYNGRRQRCRDWRPWRCHRREPDVEIVPVPSNETGRQRRRRRYARRCSGSAENARKWWKVWLICPITLLLLCWVVWKTGQAKEWHNHAKNIAIPPTTTTTTAAAEVPVSCNGGQPMSYEGRQNYTFSSPADAQMFSFTQRTLVSTASSNASIGGTILVRGSSDTKKIAVELDIHATSSKLISLSSTSAGVVVTTTTGAEESECITINAIITIPHNHVFSTLNISSVAALDIELDASLAASVTDLLSIKTHDGAVRSYAEKLFATHTEVAAGMGGVSGKIYGGKQEAEGKVKGKKERLEEKAQQIKQKLEKKGEAIKQRLEGWGEVVREKWEGKMKNKTKSKSKTR